MSSVANEIQTAIAEQQKRYEANLLGLSASLPSISNADSKTVSTSNAGDFANAMTKIDQSELEKPKDVRYIFPSNLATSRTNRYWTKIVPYEVKYNADSETYIVSSNGLATKVKLGAEMKKQKGAAFSPNEATYHQANCTIALPYPDSQPDWEFNADWGGDFDISGWLGEMFDAYNNFDASKASQGVFDAMEEVGKVIAGIGKGVLEFVNNKANPLKDGMNKTKKRVKNKRVESAFEGVRRRSFSLNWNCHPKNSNERYQLDEIISTMKSLSLPTFNSSSDFTYLTFPALFTVQFMTGQTENRYMPRFGPAACTGVSISPYNSDWHAHEDGSPISYSLKLSFQEIFPITRENLQRTDEFAWVR